MAVFEGKICTLPQNIVTLQHIWIVNQEEAYPLPLPKRRGAQRQADTNLRQTNTELGQSNTRARQPNTELYQPDTELG